MVRCGNAAPLSFYAISMSTYGSEHIAYLLALPSLLAVLMVLVSLLYTSKYVLALFAIVGKVTKLVLNSDICLDQTKAPSTKQCF